VLRRGVAALAHLVSLNERVVVVGPMSTKGLEYDATLIVDDGESMAVWQDTATRLFRVLHRLRAFNRLRMRRWLICSMCGRHWG